MMTDKILYLDCSSGISGDMTVAALVDLGVNQDSLFKALKSLNVSGYHCEVKSAESYSIKGCSFDVHLDDHHHHHHHHHHDHDEHHHDEHHKHEHHKHKHHHEDHHDKHHHHHEHRNLHDITHIIESSNLTPRAKTIAVNIFQIVADAEAKAHGKPIDEVHFHEVGAIDSIVDICAVAFCIDALEIMRCVVSPLAEGTGYVMCQHGQLPVPVPAVVNICQAHALPMQFTSVVGERITPTGAAIAAAIRTDKTLPATFSIDKIGLGVGKRDFGQVNILRAMLIKVTDTPITDTPTKDSVMVLETSIDDSTGEMLGHTMTLLLDAGARDAYFTPIYMKKNRPATLLTVIVDESLVQRCEAIIFGNTTTIGMRKYPVERTVSTREMISFASSVGEVAVKHCAYGEQHAYYPEYESAKLLAAQTDIPLIDILALIRSELRQTYGI